MGNVNDVNKNKLLNYFTQSYETERNMEVIGKIQYYLKEKTTKMILKSACNWASTTSSSTMISVQVQTMPIWKSSKLQRQLNTILSSHVPTIETWKCCER